jgi:drug/metabolite transporter (DMT)-like permease
VGALLLFAAVQLTMIGAGLVRGERPRPLEWVGLAFSFAGLVLLTRPGLARPDPLGAALMLVAGVAWGVYSLRGGGHGDAVAINAASFARALPLSLAAGGVPETPAGVWLALPGAIARPGQGQHGGPCLTRAAIVQLSVPPMAAAGAVVFLDESVSLRLVVASVLILCPRRLAQISILRFGDDTQQPSGARVLCVGLTSAPLKTTSGSRAHAGPGRPRTGRPRTISA